MTYDALRAIASERLYQKSKWPGAEGMQTIGEDILLAEELLAQARKAWAMDADASDMDALNYVRKTAATLVRTMEHNGAPERMFEVDTGGFRSNVMTYGQYRAWKENH